MDKTYKYTENGTVYKFGVVVSDEPGTDYRGERPFRPGQVLLFEDYPDPEIDTWWTVGEQIKPWKWHAKIEYFDNPRDAAERAYEVIQKTFDEKL